MDVLIVRVLSRFGVGGRVLSRVVRRHNYAAGVILFSLVVVSCGKTLK